MALLNILKEDLKILSLTTSTLLSLKRWILQNVSISRVTNPINKLSQHRVTKLHTIERLLLSLEFMTLPREVNRKLEILKRSE